MDLNGLIPWQLLMGTYDQNVVITSHLPETLYSIEFLLHYAVNRDYVKALGIFCVQNAGKKIAKPVAAFVQIFHTDRMYLRVLSFIQMLNLSETPFYGTFFISPYRL